MLTIYKTLLLSPGLKQSLLQIVMMFCLCYHSVRVNYPKASPTLSKVRQEQHEMGKCSGVQWSFKIWLKQGKKSVAPAIAQLINDVILNKGTFWARVILYGKRACQRRPQRSHMLLRNVSLMHLVKSNISMYLELTSISVRKRHCGIQKVLIFFQVA